MPQSSPRPPQIVRRRMLILLGNATSNSADGYCRTYSRTEASALGLLSLGLTNCPAGDGQQDKTVGIGSAEALSDFGRTLQKGLSALAPRSLGLPVSVAQASLCDYLLVARKIIVVLLCWHSRKQ